jgi:hypothetical protein
MLIKELIHPKMSLNNMTFLIWKEREVEDREGKAGIFNFRFCLGEIEGETEIREIERQTNKET